MLLLATKKYCVMLVASGPLIASSALVNLCIASEDDDIINKNVYISKTFDSCMT